MPEEGGGNGCLNSIGSCLIDQTKVVMLPQIFNFAINIEFESPDHAFCQLFSRSTASIR